MSGTEQTEEQKKQAELDAAAAKEKEAAGGNDAGGDDDLGDFGDPEKAKAEIKRLRKESAERRTKAKESETKLNALSAQFEKLKKAIGGEDEEADPEEQLKSLKSKNEEMEIEMSIMQISRDYDVPKDQDEYFRFLLAKKMSSLKDGEEIGDEELGEIVSKVKAVSAGSEAKPNGTGAGGAKPKPDGGGSGDVTAAQFKMMSTTEKSALYTKNPTLYDKLSKEASQLK